MGMRVSIAEAGVHGVQSRWKAQTNGWCAVLEWCSEWCRESLGEKASISQNVDKDGGPERTGGKSEEKRAPLRGHKIE
jgi:hypothetical protein